MGSIKKLVKNPSGFFRDLTNQGVEIATDPDKMEASQRTVMGTGAVIAGGVAAAPYIAAAGAGGTSAAGLGAGAGAGTGAGLGTGTMASTAAGTTAAVTPAAAGTGTLASGNMMTGLNAVSAATGLYSAIDGSIEADKARKTAEWQYANQQAFIQNLLNEARGDKVVADMLATNQLDFNNATINKAWQDATKSTDAKYGKLSALVEETLGKDGTVRALTAFDAQARKTASEAFAKNMTDLTADYGEGVEDRLKAYSKTLKDTKDETLKVVDKQIEDVATAGDAALKEAGKTIDTGATTANKAAQVAGNVLTDVEAGPTGLAAQQAGIEKNINELARQREQAAAARGTTISAGEKLSLGLARAEMLGKASAEAQQKWNADRLAAATAAAAAGASSVSTVGNRLDIMQGGAIKQGNALKDLATAGGNVSNTAAGNLLNAGETAAGNVFNANSALESQKLNNTLAIDNSAMIQLEKDYAAARAGNAAGQSDEQRAIDQQLSSGKISTFADYVSARNAAATNLEAARSAAQGVAGTAAAGSATTALSAAAAAEKQAETGAAAAKQGLVDIFTASKKTDTGNKTTPVTVGVPKAKIPSAEELPE